MPTGLVVIPVASLAAHYTNRQRHDTFYFFFVIPLPPHFFVIPFPPTGVVVAL